MVVTANTLPVQQALGSGQDTLTLRMNEHTSQNSGVGDGEFSKAGDVG